MSFEKNFCASPWFHMRINNSGSYEYCRWKSNGATKVNAVNNIKNQTPDEFFQTGLSSIRQQLLQGDALHECNTCYVMEQNKKVSGRQRQLLKVGILGPHFFKSMLSSPLCDDFNYSYNNHGNTKRSVTDWQIDLGNYCNSGCIFCTPESSSRLATEFKYMQLIQELPPNSWCDDPVLLKKFIDHLISNSNLQYLHFIGGETTITPGFRQILQALVDSGQSNTITIGFTTNLTTWSDSLNDLLTKFNSVHLGLSIETLTPINDYVRWPSELGQTLEILDKWVKFGQQNSWLIQLRTTPTCLTIGEFDTVYEYAWQNNLAVESCNFLYNPAVMRINVLPNNYRLMARERLNQWILAHSVDCTEKIINIRDPNIVQQQIIQDAQSYLNYIDNIEDESSRLPELVCYLKKLEARRGNSILDYLPHYEQLFRSAGY
jgi:MoaA/NifB/PqqE/SkfB family radical SAM enzyme